MRGLDWQATERVCAFAESDKTIAGLRDSAMIRLMSDCLLRISEVVAVDVSDFEKKTLIIHQSKTQQEGEAVALYVTGDIRRVIKRYMKKAGITEGALFRRIRRGGHVQSEQLTDFAARRIIQTRAANAGVDGFIAGHSLRVGSAVSLAQAGATMVGGIFFIQALSSKAGQLIKTLRNIGEPLLQKSFWTQWLRIVLSHILLWVCQSIAFFLFIQSLIPVKWTHAGVLSACFAFAWIVGILSFLTPGGLGVREGLLGVLLANYMSPMQATSVALLCRVWMLSAEIVLAGIAFLYNWRR